MKFYRCLSFILVFSIFSKKIIIAQNRVVLNQNVYINISGNANLVIDNSSTNAITNPTAGAIISENENNVVKWNIGTGAGNYIVPFATSSLVKIPLEVNVTTAGTGTNGSVIFSTYETTADNNTTYPSDVTNMNSVCNTSNGLYAVDRFWRIEAANYTTKPSPVINFGYNNAANEIGVTNTIAQSKLQAQRFNSGLNSWQTPQKLYGSANVALSQVNSVSVTPADFYKSWTLIDTLSMMVTQAQTVTICQGGFAFLQGANQTVAGIYKDTVNSVGNCDTAYITNLVVNPLPTLSVTNNTICTGNNGVITASGATNYTWTPAATLSNSNTANPTANPTITTIYTVTGAASNGCKQTNTVQVLVNPLPALTTTGSTICFGYSANINASGASSYTWSPSSTLSNSNSASPVTTATTTTTYTVSGVSSLGCLNTQTALVIVNPSPTITTTSISICSGSSGSLSASGASTYTWLPATSLNNSLTANPIANPTVTTIYTVTGSSGIGCSDTKTTSIVVNALPTIVTTNTSICFGNNGLINASGATNYTWTPATTLSNSNTANPTASPTITTVYTVIGASSNGCAQTNTLQVQVNPLPAITTTGSTICFGSSANINANGASSYTWSPSGSLSSSVSPSPVTNASITTIYTVSGTSSFGCLNTQTALVIVNSLPTITSTSASICSGSSATLVAGGAVSYTWSPATNLNTNVTASPIANPTVTTVYTVTGSSAAGCTNTETTTVIVNSVPNMIITNTAICIGSTGQLSAAGAVTYSWFPIATLSSSNIANPTANPTITTIYTVTGASSAGCINTTTLQVVVNALPIITTSGNSICIGNSANIFAFGASSFSWSPASSLSNSVSSNPITTTSVTTVYTVVGTSSLGCVNTETALVIVNPLPTITTTNAIICVGSSGSLSASGGSTYTWSPATFLNNNTLANPLANPTTSSIYTVTSTSSVGCVNTQTASVIVNSLPTIVTTNTSICAGNSGQLSASGAATYSWSPNTALTTTTSSTTLANPTVSTVYTVTGTSSLSCVNTATLNVLVNPLPIITINSPSVICDGESATLSSNGAITYTWNTGVNSNSITTNPSLPTTYTVSGTDVNACVNTSTVLLNVVQIPTLVVSGSNTVCAGRSVTLTAAGGINYSWNTGAVTASVVVTPTSNLTYSVNSGIAPCIGNQTYTVSIVTPIAPTVSASPQTVNYNATSTLTAIGSGTYNWSPSGYIACGTCSTTIVKPESTTIYTVTQTDQNGCTSTNTVLVELDIICGEFFVPTGFSPNNDGKNDTWCVYSNCMQTLFLQVFNRWGEKIFETENKDYCWDGLYKGVLQGSDVFMYQLTATLANGETISKKGNVTLVR